MKFFLLVQQVEENKNDEKMKINEDTQSLPLTSINRMIRFLVKPLPNAYQIKILEK